jgi:hypothetical protein
MAREHPKLLIKNYFLKKKNLRHCYPFKIKLLIPYTTHRNRPKYFVRILVVVLIPRI